MFYGNYWSDHASSQTNTHHKTLSKPAYFMFQMVFKLLRLKCVCSPCNILSPEVSHITPLKKYTLKCRFPECRGNELLFFLFFPPREACCPKTFYLSICVCWEKRVKFSQSENWNPFGFCDLPNFFSWQVTFLIEAYCGEACVWFIDQGLSFTKPIHSYQLLKIA